MLRRLFVLLGIILFLLSGLNPMSSGVLNAAGSQTLRVLWMGSPSDFPEQFEFLDSFIADFEAANPGVRVELETVDWAVGRETIIQAVEMGNPPDIALIGARWVPEFVSLGLIEPLDRYMAINFRERFVSTVINEGAIYQGRIFGLPVATSTRALFYNLDLFEQAGLEAPPQTWEELRETAQAINDLSDDVYGFGLQGGGGLETNTYYYYFVWGNSGDLYNNDHTASALNQPEAVEAMEFLQQLVEDGLTQPNPTDIAYERRRGVADVFQNGQLGMVINGPWLIHRLRAEAPDLRFGVAPIPYNTNPATYGVMDALTILSPSHVKDLAWSFLVFLYDDQRRLDYTLSAGVLPELKTVVAAPEFAQDPDYAVFLSLLEDARFEPLHIQSEEIAQIVIEAVMAVYSGESDAQTGLDGAAGRINDLLESIIETW